MDDIEDLGPSLDGMDLDETSSRNRESVTIRRTRQSAKKTEKNVIAEEYKGATPEAALPGVGTVWLKTWGCSHNVSDSEYMAGQLAVHGYEVTEDESKRDQADLWLLNSCTVKDPSQAAFVNLLRAGRDRVDKNTGQSKPAPLVLAGCVPQAERNLKSLNGLGDGVSLVGVAQLERIVEVVERTMRGECVRALSKRTTAGSNLPSLKLPKIRRNPLVEIVPLSTGCLGACTYCKTVHARGKLGSYALEDILQRIKDAISEGVTEIWLSSEDTGAYGIDLGITLTDLLRHLTEKGGPLDGTEVMVRLGMTNPPYMLNQLEAIADAMRHPNVFAFLHVPVQSGADPVLKGMNREYTRSEFDQVADGLNALLKNDGGFTLATDVICGFPGETDQDFSDTMEMFEKYQFPVLNISQFYARPGTPAAKMKKVPNGVAKSRSRALTTAFEALDPHSVLVGQTVKVWINTETSPGGNDREEQTIGHTKNYTKVLVPLDPSLVGCVATVIIEESQRWHVAGKVLSSQKIHNETVLNAAASKKAGIRPSNISTNDDGEDYGEEGEETSECCGGGGGAEGTCGDNNTECCGGSGECGDKSSAQEAPPITKSSVKEEASTPVNVDEKGREIQYDADGNPYVVKTVGKDQQRSIIFFIILFSFIAASALIYDHLSSQSTTSSASEL